ncbi:MULTISPECIES: sensor histidine kinase [unclassified Nocardioides]|uniref:sensor histidine kinase n=1 Tax=unclassified Nocardioides TaxID=2615069 RepID=UPI0006FD2485|nr:MULTISPECIES: HAMP domain-containing sensor histidine kinase [unclassified Nocardioides]KRA29399.1 ATPase [Nocardioides sp. Root614]KRA85591.1 ATPase [Nocardioides sp. Root682]
MGFGWPRSLSSRLVVTAVALVAVVSLLIGTVTTIGMRAWQTDRLDGDVRAALNRVSGFRGGGGPPGFPGVEEPGGTRVGFAEVGLVTATFSDAGDQGILARDSGRGGVLTALDGDTLEVLEDGAGRAPRTIDLPGLGSYRVASGRNQLGDKVVVGLPTDDVDEATMSLVRWELVLALLGILAAAFAGSAVVRRQLRPLREVAATAHAVAELPLDSGDIGVTERVPEHLTDVRTEAGQVGAALNQLLAHVESSLSARHRSEQQVRQFVADASHELRTPLTTIAGYTELARRRGDMETSTMALGKVEEEAGRMTALVEDLLLLARLDAGRPLASDTVDLTRLLLEAVDDARVVAPDHRWQIVLPDDGEPIEVSGDERRLHQVVTNLLTNARKYTPAGTTVTVTARANGFDVHDDGPGFPPDLVATAFERFTRGDASRHRSDGIGLGLALVQAIVAAHGGAVTLATEPGDTRVSVRLG